MEQHIVRLSVPLGDPQTGGPDRLVFSLRAAARRTWRSPAPMVGVGASGRRVTASVRERQRSTAKLPSTSWLLRRLSGDAPDGERVIAIVAGRSSGAGDPGRSRRRRRSYPSMPGPGTRKRSPAEAPLSARRGPSAATPDMPVVEAEQGSRPVRSRVREQRSALPDHALSGHAGGITACLREQERGRLRARQRNLGRRNHGPRLHLPVLGFVAESQRPKAGTRQMRFPGRPLSAFLLQIS